MNTFLLILIVIGVSVQQVAKKAYNQKGAKGVYSFSAASSLAALVVFLFTSTGQLAFRPEIVGYSVVFALAYCAATVFSLLAINTGSLSLTSLMLQYSLVIPAFYGLVMLKEPAKTTLFVGIALLLVSLVLINYEGKGEKKITLRWIIYTLIAFVGNGACSTVQKIQQLKFDGRYKSEFMIISLVITVVALAAISFCTEKKTLISDLKKGVIWYIICGAANGLVNYLVLVLSLKMPASVMFPVISAGGIVMTTLVSVFVYKEKMSIQQIFGFVLGIAAIVAMNI